MRVGHGAAKRENVALPTARCVHGAKPNRIRRAVISSARVPRQWVSTHVTITSTISATSTKVTCDRGIGGYPGASSVWRARRINRMPLPSSPSSSVAVR